MTNSWSKIDVQTLQGICVKLDTALKVKPIDVDQNTWLDCRAISVDNIIQHAFAEWVFNQKQGLHRLVSNKVFEYRFVKKNIEVRVVTTRSKQCGQLFFLTGAKTRGCSGAHFELTLDIFQNMFMPLIKNPSKKDLSKALTEMLRATTVHRHYLDGYNIHEFEGHEVAHWSIERRFEFKKLSPQEKHVVSHYGTRGWMFIQEENPEEMAEQTTTLGRLMSKTYRMEDEALQRFFLEHFRSDLAAQDPQEWQLTLLKGKDIQTAYHHHIGGQSCMSGEGRAGFTEIYASNPHCVRLAVLHRTGTEVLDKAIVHDSARCLIWFPTGKDGDMHPDRIYPNNNPKMRALMESKLKEVYPKQMQEHLYKGDPKLAWAVPVRWGPKCTIPYFDTVRIYTDDEAQPSRHLCVAGGPSDDALKKVFGGRLRMKIHGGGCEGGKFRGLKPPKNWDVIPDPKDVKW